MKKLLIASGVGAAILFVWSALAWIALPLHHHTFKYTPNQDQILNVIDQNLDESGVYFLPSADNRDIKLFDPEYKKASKELQDSMEGKPTAFIVFIKSWKQNQEKHFYLAFYFSLYLLSLLHCFWHWWEEAFPPSLTVGGWSCCWQCL